MYATFEQDILIKKGIVEKDDVLRGKGIDPDEQRLEEAIVSQPLPPPLSPVGETTSGQHCSRAVLLLQSPLLPLLLLLLLLVQLLVLISTALLLPLLLLLSPCWCWSR